MPPLGSLLGRRIQKCARNGFLNPAALTHALAELGLTPEEQHALHNLTGVRNDTKIEAHVRPCNHSAAAYHRSNRAES